MRSEKSITTAIMRWLKSQPDVYAWKTIGSMFTRNGIPDICGSVGRIALYIEVKREDGRASPRQKEEHERIRRAGGWVWIVRSLDEAKNVVTALRAAHGSSNK